MQNVLIRKPGTRVHGPGKPAEGGRMSLGQAGKTAIDRSLSSDSKQFVEQSRQPNGE